LQKKIGKHSHRKGEKAKEEGNNNNWKKIDSLLARKFGSCIWEKPASNNLEVKKEMRKGGGGRRRRNLIED